MKRQQRGAALATALLILIVLTLLGLAAMRGSRLELKLSQNAESRVNARQSAQAIADGITRARAAIASGAARAKVDAYIAASHAAVSGT